MIWLYVLFDIGINTNEQLKKWFVGENVIKDTFQSAPKTSTTERVFATSNALHKYVYIFNIVDFFDMGTILEICRNQF